MLINNNLAYPYVKAIFAVATEQDNLQAWEQLLTLWATTVQLSPKLFSTNHIVDKQKQLEIFVNICTVIHMDAFEAAKNLLKLLIAKKHLLLLPKIAALYQKTYAQHQKTLILKIVCATSLNDEQKQALKTSLEIRFKSQLQLNYEIDPSLIGGMKIYFDDQVIDLSIIGQLKQVKEILNVKC